jgi:hypothetical protein
MKYYYRVWRKCETCTTWFAVIAIDGIITECYREYLIGCHVKDLSRQYEFEELPSIEFKFQ